MSLRGHHALAALCATATGAAYAQAAQKVVDKLAVAVPVMAPSFWDVLVLGVPVGVLAASLVGSSVRALREESLPDRRIPRRALNTLLDGFIGAWVAMFLIGFTYTAAYFANVAPAVLGAIGGLLTEWIRSNGSRWAEQLWTAALSWISKRNTGATPP